jgi:hypothetical protein
VQRLSSEGWLDLGVTLSPSSLPPGPEIVLPDSFFGFGVVIKGSVWCKTLSLS